MFNHELRVLSHVGRWGITPLIHRQSVADHSFYVAVYAVQIAQLLGYTEAQAGLVAMAALFHDVAEAKTGDIPGPVKRKVVDKEKLYAFNEAVVVDLIGAYAGVVPETLRVIKVADLIDEVMYLKFEQRMGNSHVDDFATKAYNRLRIAWRKLPWQGDPDRMFAAYVAQNILDIGSYKVPVDDSDVVA